MRVFSLEECKKIFEDLNPLTDGNLCAGGEEGKGICFGDSGGPLQCNMNGQWTYIALSSWTTRCGLKSFPSVFTRLTQYIDWIQDTISQN